MASDDSTDFCTLSNYKQVRVTHTNYDFTVDMQRKRIQGICKLHVTSLKTATEGAAEMVLDTRGLIIHSVDLYENTDDSLVAPEDLNEGSVQRNESQVATELRWELSASDPILGEALHVQCPGLREAGSKAVVQVTFALTEASSAVQFLDPGLTASKKHPFLFTQCQAIHARSLCPCQDTPSVKMTYSATVSAPSPLIVLMSAQTVSSSCGADSSTSPSSAPKLTDVSTGAEIEMTTHRFEQKIPVPAYLLALAVGELESRRIGPQSRVWAEPAVVERAAWEFAETEAFISAAEELTGMPYMWGQADMLVLPASFPYGGMENPCMIFLTPSLLAGDRSATSVVAHEISHSWTGNWVSNATWPDVWLNEGWTVLYERKIIGRVCGPEKEQFQAAFGYELLKSTVQSMGEDHPYTVLVPDMRGVDPDDWTSPIPYEKGYYFLRYLENLVGGTEAFSPFAKAYLTRFGRGAISSAQFREYLMTYFAANAAVKDIDWDTWLHAPGMPPDAGLYDPGLLKPAESLAQGWVGADPGRTGELPPTASPADMEGWLSDLKLAFVIKLAQLAADCPLHSTATRGIDRLYGLGAIRDPEFRCAWLQLCIAAEDQAVLADAQGFVAGLGRMKFIRPVYQSLFQSQMGRSIALSKFEELKGGYHPIARKIVAADLGCEA